MKKKLLFDVFKLKKMNIKKAYLFQNHLNLNGGSGNLSG